MLASSSLTAWSVMFHFQKPWLIILKYCRSGEDVVTNCTSPFMSSKDYSSLWLIIYMTAMIFSEKITWCSYFIDLQCRIWHVRVQMLIVRGIKAVLWAEAALFSVAGWTVRGQVVLLSEVKVSGSSCAFVEKRLFVLRVGMLLKLTEKAFLCQDIISHSTKISCMETYFSGSAHHCRNPP